MGHPTFRVIRQSCRAYSLRQPATIIRLSVNFAQSLYAFFYPGKPSIPVTNAATVYILNCCECIVRPLNPSLVTGWTCDVAHVCLA